jgi:hypothetical protein
MRAPLFLLLTCLICVALLVARVGGAHLHLCLDGQTAASSVQLVDDLAEPQPAAISDPHRDVDLALIGDLVKPGKDSVDLDFSLLLVATLFGWLLALGRAPPPPRPQPAAVLTRRFVFRPPLRGPPLAFR